MEKEITYQDVNKIMADPSVHSLTKTTIELGLNRDPVEAYYDVLLAAEALKAIMDHLLNQN